MRGTSGGASATRQRVGRWRGAREALHHGRQRRGRPPCAHIGGSGATHPTAGCSQESASTSSESADARARAGRAAGHETRACAASRHAKGARHAAAAAVRAHDAAGQARRSQTRWVSGPFLL